jgi:uncharacterized protein YjdB
VCRRRPRAAELDDAERVDRTAPRERAVEVVRRRPLSLRTSAACRLIPVVLTAATLAACDGDEPVVVTLGPALTLNPASLALVVGETASVGMELRGGATAETRVRWTTNVPTIAVVDSTIRGGTMAGAPVAVRGLTAGAAMLTVTVMHERQTITGGVPVTVRPAP